MPKPQMSCWF